MDRVFLVDMNEITGDNVHQLLATAESFKLRLPEIIDGWYMAGICYYKLGNASEALFNLCTAYSISQEAEILRLIESLGGTPRKAKEYKLKHDLKVNNGIILTPLIFIFTVIFIYMAAR